MEERVIEYFELSGSSVLGVVERLESVSYTSLKGIHTIDILVGGVLRISSLTCQEDGRVFVNMQLPASGLLEIIVHGHGDSVLAIECKDFKVTGLGLQAMSEAVNA